MRVQVSPVGFDGVRRETSWPETSAVLLLGDCLQPFGIVPSIFHKSKTPGPLVPPIHLAGEPALFHIINSVTLLAFVWSDPEQGGGIPNYYRK